MIWILLLFFFFFLFCESGIIRMQLPPFKHASSVFVYQSIPCTVLFAAYGLMFFLEERFDGLRIIKILVT